MFQHWHNAGIGKAEAESQRMLDYKGGVGIERAAESAYAGIERIGINIQHWREIHINAKRFQLGAGCRALLPRGFRIALPH